MFAESYDDHDDQHRKSGGGGNKSSSIATGEPSEKIRFMGYPACPHKWNVYHECSLYCQNHYTKTSFDPDSDYGKKFKAMMDKYGSLPEDWKVKKFEQLKDLF